MKKPELKSLPELIRTFLLACVMLGVAIYATVRWLGGVAELVAMETLVPIVFALLVAHMFILIALFARGWFDALLNVGYAVPGWVRFSVISATIALYAVNSAIWTELIVRFWLALVRMVNGGFFQPLISDHWGKLLLASAAALIVLVSRAGRKKVAA